MKCEKNSEGCLLGGLQYFCRSKPHDIADVSMKTNLEFPSKYREIFEYKVNLLNHLMRNKPM